MLQLAVCRVAVTQPQDIFICAWGHLKFHYVRWLIKQRLHLLLLLPLPLPLLHLLLLLLQEEIREFGSC